MSKLYIFAIGGTGSRVLRSLTILFASGVQLDNGISEVVPVIIDPDRQNGDLTRTVSLMNNYISIQSKLSFPKENNNNFFKTKINRVLPNFVLPIHDTEDKKFRNFISLPAMSRENQAMMEMLFSERNLQSSMDEGFKGNPNVGSVVLNQISGSGEFINLANSFQAGDKIFIISSIFGGTGAAGFPLLLKTLRTNKDIPNYSAINKATIGAVTVLPYFRVKQDNTSEIDSSTFISKAKSALAYYERNIINNADIDALYYLGDNQNNAYDNHQGKSDQQNDAHFIELLAASAIVDFTKRGIVARTDPNFIPGTTLNMEYGAKQAGAALTLDSFFNRTKEVIFKPMTQLLLMANAFSQHFSYIKSSELNANKRLGISEDFYNSTFVDNVKEFLEAYQSWLREMKGNVRSFDIFNLDAGDKPFDILTGIKAKRYRSLKRNYNLLYDFVNDACSKVKSSAQEDRLFELYSIATNEMIKGKLNF